MKLTYFSFLYLLIFQVEDNPSLELQWKNMELLEFESSEKEYNADSIYFFHAFIKKEDLLNQEIKDSGFYFSKHAKPLDLFDYWGAKGEENYDILFTKTAYLLNQSIDFFSKNRLSDLEYIAMTMPSAKIRKEDAVYHIAMGFGAPNIDYTLHFYSNDDFQTTYPSLKSYFRNYDHLDKQPELIAVQHNFNYGQVMFQNTSKMSISISRYFAVDNQQTLVINYTLNYIHNVPPAFLGGSEFLIDKIKEGIKALIEETQNICENTN